MEKTIEIRQLSNERSELCPNHCLRGRLCNIRYYHLLIEIENREQTDVPKTRSQHSQQRLC